MFTLIITLIALLAAGYFAKQKSWFIAAGITLFVIALVIITSIIQIQLMLFTALIMAGGILWFTRSFRGDKSKDEDENSPANDVAKELDYINQQKIKRQKWRAFLGLSLVFISLIAPIGLYMQEFGILQYQQPAYWLAMVNYLTGVYAFIFATLMGMFLLSSAVVRFNKNQAKHDKQFINDSKKDLEFYLTELDHYLSQWVNDTQTRRVLLDKECGRFDEQKLSSDKVKSQIAEFAQTHPKILDMWQPLVKILDELNSPARYPYNYNHQRSLEKSTSMLSAETTVALDKLAFAMLGDEAKRSYFWER